MNQTEVIKIVAPLFFRIADKLFKFISWALILGILKYAYTTAPNRPIFILNTIAGLIYTSSLLFQGFYIAVRDPKSLGLPSSWYPVARIVQVVVSITFLIILSSPYLYIDQIIDSLIHAKIK